MKIAEFVLSMIDFPRRTSVISFVSGCNYKCPACHAKKIISSEEDRTEDFTRYLANIKGWVNGVVICGGEPTIQASLPEFADEMKKKRVGYKA